MSAASNSPTREADFQDEVDQLVTFTDVCESQVSALHAQAPADSRCPILTDVVDHLAVCEEAAPGSTNTTKIAAFVDLVDYVLQFTENCEETPRRSPEKS